MKVHHLKTWPAYFNSIIVGEKTFELRKDDRDFQLGDILILEEYLPDKRDYTGRTQVAEVTYIYKATAQENWGLQPGYCIMSIKLLDKCPEV